MPERPNGAPVLCDGVCAKVSRSPEYSDENELTVRERIGAIFPGMPGDPTCTPEGNHPSRHKPSNVLVTLHDDTPVPKVIDFGVAKALDARLTNRTIAADVSAQVIGTLLLSTSAGSTERPGYSIRR